MCYIFLRMTDKALTVANIASEVVFQQLDASGGNMVQSLANYFEKLIIPLLENNEVSLGVGWSLLQSNPVRFCFVMK